MNKAAIISAFAEYENDNYKWMALYNKLGIEANKQEKELKLTANQAFTEVDFPKNRYQNVMPYDQNRVLLKNLQEGQSDFINASPLYVPFANRDYILTQGPLETTSEDFWQMVWEQKSRIIVMLNNVIEKGSMKCYPYFVDEKHKEKSFGRFKILLEDDHGTDHYRVRKIKLTTLDDRFLENGESDSRIITHFHYINWPDFGVPSETGPFLDFLEKTCEAHTAVTKEYDQSPVVVHCSAGIGRSGAYVVVDCVLNFLENGNLNPSDAGGDMAKPPKSIDDLVIFIRQHRMGLIQTPEQLRFCWQAIVDWIKAHSKDGEAVESEQQATPRKRPSTSSSSDLEKRMQKIQEMRMKLRRVEESKNRWWCRILNDDNIYWVGSTVAVLGGVMAFYVYNNIYASK